MQGTLDLQYLKSIVKSRYLWFVVPWAIILVGGTAVTILLPPIYQSSAMLLIQSQKIPKDLVQSTVASLADERIQVIGQRTMAREKLLRIVEKFGLFRGGHRKLSSTELVDEMRERVKIEPIALALQSKGRRYRQGPTTVAFTVSFEHESPTIAAKVAGELVTIILDEDKRARNDRAAETTRFIQKEALHLGNELSKIERSITKFKQDNKDSLPGSLEVRMKALEATQIALKQVENRIIGANDGTSSNSGNTPLQQLELLKAELARKSAIYAKRHPEVRALKLQIAGLESKVGLEPAKLAKPSSDTLTGAPPVLGVPMPASNNEAAFARAPHMLRNERQKLIESVAALQRSIDRTPEVERKLGLLLRGYETKKRKFDELTAKQQQAHLGQRLEEDQQSERIEIIEQPIVPELPVKPKRLQILAIVIALAFASGAGSVVGTEYFYRSIRTSGDLINYLDVRPLVTIPYITTRRDELARQKQTKNILIGTGVGCLLVLLAIHFLYMPLDLFAFKIVMRFQI